MAPFLAYDVALVGAGAVVTKDVPAHALIVGNPAKVIGWVDEKGIRLDFTQDGLSDCGRFRLDSGDLRKL